MSKSDKGFYYVNANSELLLDQCKCTESLLLLVSSYVQELNETGTYDGIMVMPSDTDENGDPLISIGFQTYENKY